MPTSTTSDDEVFQNTNNVYLETLSKFVLIETELRDSRTLGAIIEALEADSEAAMNEFADANPGDSKAIMDLQARVHRLVFFRRTIQSIMIDGLNAQQAIHNEEMTDL